LIIRTSGEFRLSNFLIWQGAYSEYYTTPVYWPDFSREELLKAVWEYSNRRRRFGMTDEQIDDT
jgi:undecaprenyl diphosphate synthase